MTPIITFVGFTEKNSLVKAVAQELKKRGYKVGLIRESSPLSRVTTLSIPGQAEINFHQVSLCQDLTEEDFEHLVYRLFDGYDIVLGEGFADIDRLPKIEVARTKSSGNRLKGKLAGILALVSDFEVSEGLRFPFEATSEIATFIEEHILRPLNEEVTTVLFVDGRRIPMKKYVRDTLAGVVEGFVSRLKMTDNAQKIEIKICFKNTR